MAVDLHEHSIPGGSESPRCYDRIFNNVQGDSRRSVIPVILVRPAGIEPATYGFEGRNYVEYRNPVLNLVPAFCHKHSAS
jgi:hypothetical protein